MALTQEPPTSLAFAPTLNPEEAQAQLVDERLRIHEIHEFLRTEMVYAQARYQGNADHRRIAASAYRIGARVWPGARKSEPVALTANWTTVA